MQKVIGQFLLLILFLSGMWFALYQIDWMSVFKVEKAGNKLEEKLGEFYLTLIAKNEVNDSLLLAPLDTILSKICKANKIERESIQLHLVENDEINALALPDGHIVIFSGLVDRCNTEAELCGVICHELAHIQHNHVMKKVVSEIGMSALVSLTAGGAGGEVIKEAMHVLTAKAYDRSLEKEADLAGVEYMINANINPEGLANFMFALSLDGADDLPLVDWLQTHPASQNRGEYIANYIANRQQDWEMAVDPKTWQIFKENIKAL